MTENLLAEFIKGNTYDVRETGSGRWIDQKCAPDAVNFVASCVLNYINTNNVLTFHSPDIWRSPWANEKVQDWFSKPDPMKVTATDEYNKFFRQPLKMLAAAKVLSESKPHGNAIVFKVENKPALEFVAERDWNAYVFLCLYIEKTLKDSDLWDAFASFFDAQNKHYYAKAKTAFSSFCIKYTPIKTEVEAARIFAKVLNPLAYKFKKCGTIDGRMSPYRITLGDLKYNRVNFRDAGKKPKDVTRQDADNMAISLVANSSWTLHKVAKAKNDVNDFNKQFNDGLSEVTSPNSSGLATQMHHMFMQSQYPDISDFRENIVALTPTQHLTMAHPRNNTSTIDREFQRICLLCKLKTIQHNISHGIGAAGFYDFNRMMEVLDTGFGCNVFVDIPEGDYTTVKQTIETQY